MGATSQQEAEALSRFNTIPADLIARCQWVVWKYVQKVGADKPAKVPFSPRTGRRASTIDSATWSTFSEACTALDSATGYAGIGFVFTDDDPYVGIDLDRCIEPETGQLKAWADDFVTRLNSYTELTPSGRGLHVIARGRLPDHGRKKGDIEMYQSMRFFTVTGKHWASTPTVIEGREAAITELHERVFGQRAGVEVDRSDEHTKGTGRNDEEVVQGIRESRSAAAFDLLWSGAWAALGHPSHSEGDLALAAILMAACGNDLEQADRLFRESKMYRPKWDEKRGDQTYGDATLERARSVGVPATCGTDRLLDELNARFAVVTTGSRVRILCEERGSDSRVQDISLLSKTDFLTLEQNRPAPLGKGSAGAWWITHPRRKEYRRIDFLPGGAPADVYNLWQGFPIAPVEGNCSLWWQFVREVVANKDQAVYEYLRRYLAHLIQRPQERPEVALVQRGGQGTGKNTFADTVGRLVEPHYRPVTSMERITGRFNGHYKNALVVHANEAIWGGNKAEAGTLKALITDPTLRIEQKGVDSIEVANHLRLIVSSNERWAVPLDSDDRRFLILDAGDSHAQDRAYFGALHAELSTGGLAALMHDLTQENLTGFHPRAKPPTRFGVDLKLRNASSAARWWYECLEAGCIAHCDKEDDGIPGSSGSGWPNQMGKRDAHAIYRSWCRAHNEHHPESESELFKQLKQFAPGCQSVRPSAAASGARPRLMRIPLLPQSRREFEAFIGSIGRILWSKV